MIRGALVASRSGRVKIRQAPCQFARRPSGRRRSEGCRLPTAVGIRQAWPISARARPGSGHMGRTPEGGDRSCLPSKIQAVPRRGCGVSSQGSFQSAQAALHPSLTCTQRGAPRGIGRRSEPRRSVSDKFLAEAEEIRGLRRSSIRSALFCRQPAVQSGQAPPVCVLFHRFGVNWRRRRSYRCDLIPVAPPAQGAARWLQDNLRVV